MKSHQRNHAVSLSKLDNNNNNKSIAICSTHQQHILSFQSNKKPVMNKSPIVKLKERIETLKKTVSLFSRCTFSSHTPIQKEY